LLFTRKKNARIVKFGTDLADWLAGVARFQTDVSDDNPFPFERWDIKAR